MPVGTDIVKISRMERMLKKGIPSKIFSQYESEYITASPKKYETAAGIFAAKEAILKLLGTGITLPLRQVCIRHRANGSPYPELQGVVLEHAQNCAVDDIDISISHDGEYAMASAYAVINPKMRMFYKALKCFDTDEENIITPLFASSLIVPRKPKSHKGDYGRLCVLAGSKGLTGAASLACDAALKCGTGLITLLCPEELNAVFECKLTEAMTKPVRSTDGHVSALSANDIIKNISSADVCLMGPGLGRSEDVCSLIPAVVGNTDKPLVLDADALYAISKNPDILKKAICNTVITPHIGEFSVLTGIDKDKILSEPYKCALEFASKYNVIVVLKSHKTVVCTPEGKYAKNILGNPGMATGGSGDVLSGCISAFMAQGIKPYDAARLGVYIHSLSGDMAKEDKGEYSLTPTDMIDFLPYAVKYTEKKEVSDNESSCRD